MCVSTTAAWKMLIITGQLSPLSIETWFYAEKLIKFCRDFFTYNVDRGRWYYIVLIMTHFLHHSTTLLHRNTPIHNTLWRCFLQKTFSTFCWSMCWKMFFSRSPSSSTSSRQASPTKKVKREKVLLHIFSLNFLFFYITETKNHWSIATNSFSPRWSSNCLSLLGAMKKIKCYIKYVESCHFTGSLSYFNYAHQESTFLLHCAPFFFPFSNFWWKNRFLTFVRYWYIFHAEVYKYPLSIPKRPKI